jgi:hypothetical protein
MLMAAIHSELYGIVHSCCIISSYDVYVGFYGTSIRFFHSAGRLQPAIIPDRCLLCGLLGASFRGLQF